LRSIDRIGYPIATIAVNRACCQSDDRIAVDANQRRPSAPGNDVSKPPTTTPAKAILLGRCPRCGTGRLFASPFTLTIARDCDHCHLDYSFAEIGDGPAVFAIFILGVVVLAGAMIAEFKLGIPFIYHMPVWVVVTPLLALWLLRRLKATLMAIQHSQRGNGPPASGA
jgi:uncharacterized protein (DUF983 family)